MFLTDGQVSDALGRGAGMFHIPDVSSEEGGFYREGFYVNPEDGDAGVVVVLVDESAILVRSEDFKVKRGRGRWIGEGSQGHTLEVVPRAVNVRRL